MHASVSPTALLLSLAVALAGVAGLGVLPPPSGSPVAAATSGPMPASGPIQAGNLTVSYSNPSATVPLTATFTLASLTGSRNVTEFDLVWHWGDKSSTTPQTVTGVTSGTATAIKQSHKYNASGQIVMYVSVRDSASDGMAFPTLTLDLHSASLVAKVVTVPANLTTDVGVPINITIVAVGGVAPYSYHWNHVPASCSLTSPTVQSIICRPTASGSFVGNYSVNDSATPVSNNSVDSFSLLVNPALAVAFTESATYSCLGATPYLYYTYVATYTGGTAPYNFTWDFGDGSAPGTGTSTTHTTEPGSTSTVTLNLTDAAGGYVTNATTVTAASPGCSVASTPYYGPPIVLLEAGAVLAGAVVVVLLVILLRTKKPPAPEPLAPASVPAADEPPK